MQAGSCLVASSSQCLVLGGAEERLAALTEVYTGRPQGHFQNSVTQWGQPAAPISPSRRRKETSTATGTPGVRRTSPGRGMYSVRSPLRAGFFFERGRDGQLLWEMWKFPECATRKRSFQSSIYCVLLNIGKSRVRHLTGVFLDNHTTVSQFPWGCASR